MHGKWKVFQAMKVIRSLCSVNNKFEEAERKEKYVPEKF